MWTLNSRMIERKHTHILNVARDLCIHATLPNGSRGKCVLTTCYLANHAHTHFLKGSTPYMCLFGIPPSYENIRVLGCSSHTIL